jgi:hypothetical protein
MLQELDDGEPGGVGERLEDVGFEAAEGVLHMGYRMHAYIRYYEYSVAGL